MSVLSNSAESYTISAIDNAVIVEFTKAAVVQLMREAADFGNTMETLYEQGSVWAQARSSPVLSNLPPEAVDRLLEHAYLRVLRPGEVLYREGDPPSGIYLVKDGFLRVARQSRDGERVRSGSVGTPDSCRGGEPCTSHLPSLRSARLDSTSSTCST